MHVTTSDESLLILRSAKDPHVTPFDPQVWTLLVATVFVASLAITLTTEPHPESMEMLWKSLTYALFGTVGIFLEQVTPGRSQGKLLAGRLAILSEKLLGDCGCVHGSCGGRTEQPGFLVRVPAW